MYTLLYKEKITDIVYLKLCVGKLGSVVVEVTEDKEEGDYIESAMITSMRVIDKFTEKELEREVYLSIRAILYRLRINYINSDRIVNLRNELTENLDKYTKLLLKELLKYKGIYDSIKSEDTPKPVRNDTKNLEAVKGKISNSASNYNREKRIVNTLELELDEESKMMLYEMKHYVDLDVNQLFNHLIKKKHRSYFPYIKMKMDKENKK